MYSMELPVPKTLEVRAESTSWSSLRAGVRLIWVNQSYKKDPSEAESLSSEDVLRIEADSTEKLQEFLSTISC